MSRTEMQQYDYCNQAIQMEGVARGVFLTLGEMLYKIRESRMYEPHWSSWNEYCMEFKDMSQGSISKVIAVYETFVLKFGYTTDELSQAGGWTKLYALTPHIKTKEDAEKWLGVASTLNRSDLAKTLLEAKTGISMSDCPHIVTHTIRICDKCGERWETHN